MGKRIGIDVGGTNVKIALVDKSGKIIYSNSVPTYAKMGYEYTVNNIKQAIKLSKTRQIFGFVKKRESIFEL